MSEFDTLIEEIELSSTSIKNSDYEKLLTDCNSNCHDYHIALYQECVILCKENKNEKFYVLNFLRKICSLNLISQSAKAPLQKILSCDKNEIITAEHFTKNELQLLNDFNLFEQNAELAARIADLAWTINRNKDAAKFAITNYIVSADSPYCMQHWYERINRLERALRISRLIKSSDSEEIIKNKLFEYINPDHALFIFTGVKRALEISLEFGFLDKVSAAERATIIADQAVKASSKLLILDCVTNLYEFSNKIFSNLAQDARRKLAEVHRKKAEVSPSSLVKAAFINQAILALQTCADSSKEVQQLKEEQVAYNLKTLEEMRHVSTQIDLNNCHQHATSIMTKKDINSAMLAFVEISPIVPVKELEKLAVEIANQNPISHLMEKRMINKAGKLVAIVPSLLPDKTNEACYQHSKFHYHVNYFGFIKPALDILMMEHHINIDSLQQFVDQSCIVPQTRRKQWIKAILFGLQGDFDTALHLLIPQLENGLRLLLEFHGESVWNVDNKTGLHSEKSLMQLLDMPTMIQLFGEDIVFHLKCLLTEKTGFNIRNEISHGLAEEAELSSQYAAYAWWLILKIVIDCSRPDFN
ncbi:MAG: DUF4209 domain-containing protein [Gammaproteobacteria bacterium]|nr:DUF4209 domain-containing protein [Gammaproteobacteria bacterium]